MMERIKQSLPGVSASFRGFLKRRSLPAKTTLLFLATILLGVFIAGFIPINLPLVPEQISKNVESAIKGPCHIGKVTVALWSGFTIRDVYVKSPQNIETAFEVSVPEIKVGFRLLPLLFKHIRLHECIIRKPVITLSMNPKKKALEKKAPKAGAGPSGITLALPGPLASFTFSLGIAAVESGSAVVNMDGSRMVECSGIDVEASVRSLQSGSCEVEIGKLKLMDSWKVKNFVLKLKLDGNEATIDKLEAVLYGGSLQGNGVYNLETGRLARFDLRVKDLDIGPFYDDFKGRQGRFKGRANATVHLRDCAPTPDSLAGNGNVHLDGLSAQELPIQKLASLRILAPLISQMMLKELDVEFRLKSGRIYTDKVNGHGNLYDVSANGWVGFNAALNENAHIIMNETGVAQFSRIIEYAFVREADGRYHLRLAVTGTFDKPVVTFDRKNVENTVRKVLMDVGKGLNSFLKRK